VLSATAGEPRSLLGRRIIRVQMNAQ
jgi:hypothetical protein